MIEKNKTPSSFSGRACHDFAAVWVGACHHYRDALSSFCSRLACFESRACHHYRDILEYHGVVVGAAEALEQEYNQSLLGAKPPCRPLDFQYLTGGQAAVLLFGHSNDLVPMPPFVGGDAVAGRGYAFALCGSGVLK